MRASLYVRTDHAAEIKSRLVDPRFVCDQLGLSKGAQRQARGILICCPAHGDRIPSCSVTRGLDGTIRVKCFACDFTGDVFNLVAAVHQLDVRNRFPDVLKLTADLANYPLDNTPCVPTVRPKRIVPEASKPTYPPIVEVNQLWRSCIPVSDDPEVRAWLQSRGLDPLAVEDMHLAMALPKDATTPSWARCKGSWSEGGYRLIVPMFDAQGVLQSMRARTVIPTDGPKAVPPAGFSVAGLVMADLLSRQILETGAIPEWWTGGPLKILITEGEPDWLTWSTNFSNADENTPAVFGIANGSWTQSIADRIPSSSIVKVRTDDDEAGYKYAKRIADSLRGRCILNLRKRAP